VRIQTIGVVCSVVALTAGWVACGGADASVDSFNCQSLPVGDSNIPYTCTHIEYFQFLDTQLSQEETSDFRSQACQQSGLDGLGDSQGSPTDTACPADSVAQCSALTVEAVQGDLRTSDVTIDLSIDISFYDDYFYTSLGVKLRDTDEAKKDCEAKGGYFVLNRQPKGATTNPCPSGQSCEALTNGDSACFVGGTTLPFDAPACGDGFTCDTGRTPVSDNNNNCFCAEKC